MTCSLNYVSGGVSRNHDLPSGFTYENQLVVSVGEEYTGHQINYNPDGYLLTAYSTNNRRESSIGIYEYYLVDDDPDHYFGANSRALYVRYPDSINSFVKVFSVDITTIVIDASQTLTRENTALSYWVKVFDTNNNLLFSDVESSPITYSLLCLNYDYVNGACILKTNYNTPGIYADLTACQNAISDGSFFPVLVLTPMWAASKKVSIPLNTSKLGDGYRQDVTQGINTINGEWAITSPILFGTEIEDLLFLLRSLCATSFLWSPNNGLIPYKEFACEQWEKTRLGLTTYQVSTTFRRVIVAREN